MKTSFVFPIVALLIFAILPGCAPSPAMIPVTGGELTKSELASINAVRNDVLDFIDVPAELSSERPAIPPASEWEFVAKLNPELGSGPEYEFGSGNWIMILRQSDSSGDYYNVAVSNTEKGFYWCGVVSKNGSVLESLPK